MRILTNDEVIAVNQDKLGVQGNKTKMMDTSEIWAVPLSDGSKAVILLNRGNMTMSITAQWSDIGWDNSAVSWFKASITITVQWKLGLIILCGRGGALLIITCHCRKLQFMTCGHIKTWALWLRKWQPQFSVTAWLCTGLSPCSIEPLTRATATAASIILPLMTFFSFSMCCVCKLLNA